MPCRYFRAVWRSFLPSKTPFGFTLCRFHHLADIAEASLALEIFYLAITVLAAFFFFDFLQNSRVAICMKIFYDVIF